MGEQKAIIGVANVDGIIFKHVRYETYFCATTIVSYDMEYQKGKHLVSVPLLSTDEFIEAARKQAMIEGVYQ